MNENENQAARTVAALAIAKPAPFTVPLREFIPQGAKRMKHRKHTTRHPSAETVPIILHEMARYDSTVSVMDLHVHVRGKIPDFTSAALTNRLLVMRINGLTVSPTRGWWALTDAGRDAAKTAVLPPLKFLGGGKYGVKLGKKAVNGADPAADESLDYVLGRALEQLGDLASTLKEVRAVAGKSAARNAKLDKLVRELTGV